ncbi:MAG: hypothetical protein WBM17_02135 [Anaerolineales bacterium]
MKPWKMVPLVLLLFGCGSVSATVSNRVSTSTKRLPADATQSPEPIKLNSGPFTLTVFYPADDAVVDNPQLTVLGEVSSDAVVTINEATHIVYAGPFRQTISLAEGLNTIQIIASDMDGNEVEAVLTVTYQP